MYNVRLEDLIIYIYQKNFSSYNILLEYPMKLFTFSLACMIAINANCNSPLITVAQFKSPQTSNVSVVSASVVTASVAPAIHPQVQHNSMPVTNKHENNTRQYNGKTNRANQKGEINHQTVNFIDENGNKVYGKNNKISGKENKVHGTGNIIGGGNEVQAGKSNFFGDFDNLANADFSKLKFTKFHEDSKFKNVNTKQQKLNHINGKNNKVNGKDNIVDGQQNFVQGQGNIVASGDKIDLEQFFRYTPVSPIPDRKRQKKNHRHKQSPQIRNPQPPHFSSQPLQKRQQNKSQTQTLKKGNTVQIQGIIYDVIQVPGKNPILVPRSKDQNKNESVSLEAPKREAFNKKEHKTASVGQINQIQSNQQLSVIPNDKKPVANQLNDSKPVHGLHPVVKTPTL